MPGMGDPPRKGRRQMLDFIKRLVTWWHGSTLGTQIFTARNGVKVGEDAQGNTFYRSRDGKRRWVIFKGEAEASRVSPDWHGWLHHTWDEPPSEKPVTHKDWEKPHLPNLTGTPRAYAPAGSIRRIEPEERRDYEPWSPE
jgi:NADH:ubiquinone oxidoreductase subunit